MTVGELVNERIAMQARQGRGGIANESDLQFRIASAPLVAMQSLGIWDAEVHEGKVHHGFDTDCPGFYPLDGSESSCLGGLVDPSYGGEPVRFIVLLEGKKK